MTMLAIDAAATRAIHLWEDLAHALTRFEEALERVISERAWEPLGYSSFADAWVDRMQGTRLATSRQAATVVYALLDSGASREEAMESLGAGSGVAPITLDRLIEQREAGVPAHLASTRVRRHERSLPSPPSRITVELTHEEWTYLRDLCEARGLDLHAEAAAAVRSIITRLERTGVQPHP